MRRHNLSSSSLLSYPLRFSSLRGTTPYSLLPRPSPQLSTSLTTTTAAAVRPAQAILSKRDVHVVFIAKDGKTEIPVDAKEGKSILEVAHENNVDIEGACEGSLACSTCHVILEKDVYDRLLETKPPVDEEEDMLDLAFGLTETSRLGCQIIVSKDLEGMRLRLPAATRNMQLK
jgi:ferredoxin